MVTRQEVQIDAVRSGSREVYASLSRRVQLKSAPFPPGCMGMNQFREPFERRFVALDQNVPTLAIVHNPDI